jgi:Fic family protein
MNKLKELSTLKKELDNSKPLHQTTLESIIADLKLKYTYNSNALEGNTLTIYETKAILENGVTIGGKSMREHLEVINHDKAIDLLLNYVSHNEPLELNSILSFHAIILRQINDEWAGRFRNIPVRISGSKHLPLAPSKVYDAMEKYILNMKKLKQELHPVEYAAIAHAYLASIHPFVDGNGRTCRLIMNMELMKSGYPMVLINVNDRAEYCRLLELGDINNDYTKFIDFIADCTKKSLEIYLEAIQENIL